ncbi:glucose 1-dehydrogenase [Yinghuangia aomiensis]|uniref:Glucose 1-dehydrogenase n=1 Tax=Yinghuangia aomiensis TaxID=676205 RepID=A0ABP9IDD7_9ACTN
MTDGPVALVTGGGNGIGLACVRRLADDGYRVVVADVAEDAGRQAEAEIPRTQFIRCDVTNSKDLRRVAAKAVELGDGRLHALVNNAGRTSRTTFAECDEQAWRELHAVNLDSVHALTRACLPALRAARGAVVSLASAAGLIGTEGLAAYSSTKAAIIALTRSLALEHGDTVRFNAVCPGDIETAMMNRILADAHLRNAMLERIPAGRFGQPEEVANVIVWLLSDQASYVNGVALPVDGGLTAGLRDVKLSSALDRNP